jgi:hypothetical protein
MLLEASPWSAGLRHDAGGARARALEANLIYAQGLGVFLQTIHAAGVQDLLRFAAFTTSSHTLMSARAGAPHRVGAGARAPQHHGTAITVPRLFFVMQNTRDAAGQPVPAQLLAFRGEQLWVPVLGVTVWLVRTQARWPWFVTGLPTLGCTR